MTRKIGILYGQENTFPQAFIDKVNELSSGTDIVAEPVKINKVVQGAASGYAVILDRISQDVPFYRAYLKNAALSGTYIINNPFWWSADEKFFNNALATKIGIHVPKTVILPSYQMPEDTDAQSFRNMEYPLDWASIFEYIGFPAYMKPFAGGGWKNVYKIHHREEFYEKHHETNRLVMMLQENIDFEEYYRCYCVGGKEVRIMPYEPRHPHAERYNADFRPDATLQTQLENAVLTLNQYLGYDLNTVELAVRDGIPYAIDFCNPAPDADLNSVGQENFEWIVEKTAKFAIAKAKEFNEDIPDIHWGAFVQKTVGRYPLTQHTNPDL